MIKKGTCQSGRKTASSKKHKRISISTPFNNLTISLRILGLILNSSVTQIKASFRRLAMENNPDRFVKMGDVNVQKVTEEMARMNHDYESFQRNKKF